MSRRASLPGAAELFRTTSAAESVPLSVPAPPPPGVGAVPPMREVSADPAEAPEFGRLQTATPNGSRVVRSTRRVRPVSDSAPTGRERHEEKITVYCSPEELL